jgi:phosphoribosylformylglycinamidine (FGAM) synthase PurS component
VVKIVVDVMLKPEIHDPQGEAIAGACHRLGFTEVVSVRQGKRFEVEIADAEDTAISGEPGLAGSPAEGAAEGAPPRTPEGQASDAGPMGIGGAQAIRVAELAAELLANPVIEEFTIHGP